MDRPPDVHELASEIQVRLAGLPHRTAATMRTVRRDYSQRLALLKPDFVIGLALQLFKHSDPLCRFVAYELILHHKPAFEALTQHQLLKLGEGLNSWSTVDGFACYLSGPIWRDGRLPDELILEWTRNPDRWWRRAALVSTVALSRRGHADDVRKTAATCAVLILDRDDMVVKALSWALRELAKKNPQQARKFLEHHRTNLAARVIREVENKLSTGLKTPRRRAV